MPGMPLNWAEVGHAEGGRWCWCGLSSPARCAWWSTDRWRSHQKRERGYTGNHFISLFTLRNLSSHLPAGKMNSNCITTTSGRFYVYIPTTRSIIFLKTNVRWMSQFLFSHLADCSTPIHMGPYGNLWDIAICQTILQPLHAFSQICWWIYLVKCRTADCNNKCILYGSVFGGDSAVEAIIYNRANLWSVCTVFARGWNVCVSKKISRYVPYFLICILNAVKGPTYWNILVGDWHPSCWRVW